MPHLHALLLTKDDDLILPTWLARHHELFQRISVVDGSRSDHAQKVCKNYANVLHRRDPEGLITDQTLRHAAFEQLRPHVQLGDWIFVAHPDEFLIHDPRSFMALDVNLMMWLPLPVLPHTSEKAAWSSSLDKDPVKLFKHYWWRRGSLPHCEHRMWRYIKEPIWDLQSPKKGSTVIPINYHSEAVFRALPLYLHYKCFDIRLENYDSTGLNTKSGLDTRLHVPINKIDDLFFDENHPMGDGYFHHEKFSSVEQVFQRFGNPPSITHSENGLTIVNSEGNPIH